MHPAESSPLQHLPAGLTIASATLVLLGRAISIPSLDRVLCALGPMKANAAGCFLLAGVSLVLCRRAATGRASAVIGEALGAVVVLIGTLTVAESFTATDWGTDRLLYFRSLACDADVRMPPITASAFVLIGLALMLRHRGRARRASDVLASATALFTSISVLGFLYGASATSVTGRFAAMTPGAAALFTLLCGGFFLSYAELHRSTPLYGSNPESAALRRLLVATFLWPTIGGWALVSGVRVGLYDVALGTAILVALGFAVFAVLILRHAHDLDTVRRTQEEAESRFRDLVEFSPDGILTVDRTGLIRMANKQAGELFGRPRTELVGQPIETLLPAKFRAQHVADRTEFQGHPRVRRMGESRQLTALRKDGREVIATVRDVTERTQAEEALRNSEARHRALLKGLPDLIFILDSDAVFLDYHAPDVSLPLVPPERFLGRPVSKVLPPEVARRFEAALAEALRTDQAQSIEYAFAVSESQPRHFEARVIPIQGRTVTVVARDVTERKALAVQLRQGQKMEAIGRLAGGIAHDFNNLLTAIGGYNSFVLQSLDETDSRRADLLEVQKAADRAAALTRQLLAFSRRQVLQFKVLDVNGLVADVQKLLRRTIPENIDLVLDLDLVLEPVRADPGQLEQVVLNLAVNARDAMPHGGQLRFVNTTVDVGEAWARRHPPMPPGRYVRLVMSDTGMGMPPETQARIFEPFFTTKERGKGTGLGLATVYGIVKQSGGFIWVDSEVGRGTTFEVYLPVVQEPIDQPVQIEPVPEITGGSETILLAEDDGAVRRLARDVLTN